VISQIPIHNSHTKWCLNDSNAYMASAGQDDHRLLQPAALAGADPGHQAPRPAADPLADQLRAVRRGGYD
jgi:hypothetical protein